MKTARVICNVGYFNGNGEPEVYNAFLCKASSGEEFIAILKPAVTILGTAYLKTLCWIKRENLDTQGTNNIPTSIKNRLAFNIDAVLADEVDIYNRIKPAVFAAETGIYAITTTSYTTVGAVPAAYTVLGISSSTTEVDALKDVTGIDEPVGNGGTTSIIPVSAAGISLPELQKDPIGAAQAAFSNPIDYAKANPISAAVMVVGIAELGSQLGFWKFSPLKVVGLRKGKR